MTAWPAFFEIALGSGITPWSRKPSASFGKLLDMGGQYLRSAPNVLAPSQR
ncbi:MAG TPA: hypothetical protein VF744_06755 [Beijerinckiaceae bacterium]